MKIDSFTMVIKMEGKAFRFQLEEYFKFLCLNNNKKKQAG